MNIVKGVADLLRRSAGSQGGEASSWSKLDKLSPPSPKIRFGGAGEEAVLNNLWQRYENTVDKTEKRKLLQVFLLHFIQTYKNWEPADDTQVVSGSSTYSTENASEDIVVGCSSGHPSEVILILIQEISRITTLVTDLTMKASLPNLDQSEPSVNLSFSSEVLYVLKSLTIITRSLHNCRVFSYYGGVQKISALLKGSVIQLKTFSGALSEENMLGPEREKIGLLQKILVFVVSIIFIFTDVNPEVHEKAQYIIDANSFSKDILFPNTLAGSRSPVSEARFQWQQKAIVLVMEAGGVNWLVELLRVIRRLNMKEYWTEWSLRYLSLCALRSTLYHNPRGQNHFRSIGGLEVFLDGLGLPSHCYGIDKSSLSDIERSANNLCGILQLQILSLEVLRESIYGNLNNLQFLCENGRIQKFANSICSPAFVFQDFPQLKPDHLKSVSSLPIEMANIHSSNPLSLERSEEYYSIWAEYCSQLSKVLCSFLLSVTEKSPAPSSTVSFSYWELSVKWVMKVLLSVFPCIKACSSENELPDHLRMMAHNLQHHSLCAFRKFLAFAPQLLEVLREEGLWDFIFSENFFYFWPVLDSSTNLDSPETRMTSNSTKDRSRQNEVDILQMEAISFLEFAATLSGNAHNFPECSVLLETLEQSACNPDIANVLVKSLHRIFELATEQTISSFISLDGISRVLKVACIQAHEYRKLCNLSPNVEDHADMLSADSQIIECSENAYSWVESMVSSLELFTEYISVAENAKSLILNNSSCVDCLFDLFWEERVRRKVLSHILQLMKLHPSSMEDRVSLLHLSSKYLETFTRAKDNTKNFAELSIDLLVGMRDVLHLDQIFYQALFRDGECFLHIVSLLNGALDDRSGEQLVLNVLHTLTLLLAENDKSKAAFKALVGVGYQTLQSLLLDFCQSRPSMELLNALLDMLVDGKSDTGEVPLIKNEDVVMLFLSVLQKCSDSLQHYGLDIFQKLIKDSITNRTICFRAGMLSFILDWFSLEQNDETVLKLAQLIQIIGGYSVSGKDIRKLFALLRSEKIGSSQNHCSLLLASIQSMLKEKGPTAFFEFSGDDSGIVIESPIQWPYNKGFSFSCWLRVENFSENELMGLFSFYTENGKGSSAMLGMDKLVFESVNQKRQSVTLSLNLIKKKWHFLCITHSIGRAFSGGSLLKCYVDGDLVSSEKCRYAKIAEGLTDCSIGTTISIDDETSSLPVDISSPFSGQIGPIYMFGDALSSEQVKGMYLLGPTYMYAFTDNEVCSSDNSLSNALFDSKDGLSSRIIFGLNAQASNGQTLFNVSTVHERIPDKNTFQAAVKEGTRLCTRRMLQEIIYCVGGVSVFFPLLTRLDSSETFTEQYDRMLIRSIMSDRVVAEVLKLIASVLDENFANQQQMHLISGFSILGFLFQSIPPQQLNMEALSSLKHLLQILKTCGMSDVLLKDAILRIYLNPHIWLYVDYEVQRELYMFLIQQFENDAHQLPAICGLPRVIDMIRQFYWDKAEAPFAFGVKPLLHPTSRQVLAERPSQAESQKIRLLLLSFAEMSLKQKIETTDIKALVAFFERSQDMRCVEDVLQMVLRGLSQKTFLASFLEQVNQLGGCHVFINLLQRELEPIRLLGLQLLSKLLVGSPPEKKGQKFFNLAVGRPKAFYESYRKGGNTRVQPMYLAMSDRLSKFPLSENLCATLFDALLGGASPKQVLQKHNLHERSRSLGVSSHFFLPQILILIFNFLASCDDKSVRQKILYTLLDLLDSNASNIEALMENCWYSWLTASMDIDMINNYDIKPNDQAIGLKEAEPRIVRNIYCIVLSHYLYSVKGGWQCMEETVNFLLLHSTQGSTVSKDSLLNILGDLVGTLIGVSSEENIFISQPCRDNMLYFLKLTDEMIINETSDMHLFPKCLLNKGVPSDLLNLDSYKDMRCSVLESLNEEFKDELPRIAWRYKTTMKENVIEEELWNFYDNIWVLLCELNGKGSSKSLLKSSSATGPSFGQRARGLVESLNIPAAEMAAVVVTGGIGNALAGKVAKVDKAMLLRGEKCPRIIFRLLTLYLCEANFERAAKCIQQFILLLPCIFSFDDEQNKNRFHLFVWSMFWMRSKFEEHNDDSRFDMISHLIQEMINHGKTILNTFLMSSNDSSDISSIMTGADSIDNLIQKERVINAAIDEAKYIKSLMSDRGRELQEYRVKVDENLVTESTQKRAFEDEIQSSINDILSADDNRKTSYQLSYDEDQQIVAEKWIHMFRALIDERGPWSANDFPNKAVMRWKLDKAEDIWRRRPKLKRNYHFDEKLCYPPTTTFKETSTIPINDSLSGTFNVPEQMKRFLLKGVRGITDEGSMEQSEDVKDLGEKAGFDPHTQNQGSDIVDNHKIQTEITPEKKSGTSAVENKESSEVLLSIPCVLVTPKRKLAGHLAVMHTAMHFSGDFLVEGSGGSSVFKRFQVLDNSDSFDQLSGSNKDKLQKSQLNLSQDSGKVDNDIKLQNMKKVKRHRRWKVNKIKAVHWTRYLLQYTAIEIFFSDSVSPVFLNFQSSKHAKDVGTLLVSLRNEILFPKGGSKDKSGVITFVDRRVAVELAEMARESWRRRELSNFEYLMILNTLSGRSYNDLTQYPIFPWVLADYTSEKLDFNNSSTFRDLSKPVGALNPKRFEVFEDRYRNFCDPDIPSFFYGSHYSSMGIVLFYLLRLEPFTALHRNLQGGKFDHADRLFHSIEGTYRNCMSNTSDVKELIPEFFYMPEFLQNSNSYHFGVKQDGDPLTDVLLPPWAKGSTDEFIYRNREALESEFVSSNLHQWIDLIFGYKQRGKPAVEAANVFYYLTYEAAVDLESMDDDIQRAAIEDQIANFGQTPIQIFRKKHPRRGPPIPISHPLYFAPASITLTSSVYNSAISHSSVLFIGLVESNIVIVNEGLSLSVKMWLTTQLQSGGNLTFSSSQEPFFGIGSDVLPSRKIGAPLAENVELGRQSFATLQTTTESFLVSCGSWDNSFQVVSLTDGRTVQSIRRHKDIVSCVAVTSDRSILATGSYDTTVMVWDILQLRTVEKKPRNTLTELPSKDRIIIENPFHILCGHDDIITCLFVSVDLDIVISGSKDGTCIFHTLREGRYVRSIEHPSGSPLSKLVASQHGRLVVYAENDLSLHMYSINGKHMAFSESNGRLNCIELSHCGEFLVCGGDHGQIILRSMHALEVVRRYDGNGKPITSLTVTPEECFLAGTKDGTLLVYSIENPQLRRSSLPRNTKLKASIAG